MPSNSVVRAAVRSIRSQRPNPQSDMVARIRPGKVSVASGSTDPGVQRTDPKAKQKWKYPGGHVERLPSVWVDSGVRLHDHIDTSMPRRRQESTFFITLNTNRAATTHDELQQMKEALEVTLATLGSPAVLPTWMKFGPKNPEVYGNDKWKDVVRDEVGYEAKVEIGPELKRVHAHIMLTIVHYSQIQVWVQMLQQISRRVYNAEVNDNPETKMTAMPFVHVKMLPQRMWNDIMRGYLRKGMQLSGEANELMGRMDSTQRLFSK